MLGSRKSYKSKKLRQKRRKIFLLKITALLVFFFIIIGFLAWLSFRPSMNIENIKIEGNSIISDKDINQIIKNNISGKYLWVFNKGNFLIYPKKAIEQELLDKFKRLSYAQIKFDDFQSIFISVKERKPSYLWCQKISSEDKKIEEKHKDCYFVDKAGYIFAKAPIFSGIAFFEFYTKPYVERGVIQENILGKFVLKPELFRRIILFKDIVDDFSLKNHTLIEKKYDDYEILLDSGGKILFNIDDNLENALNNLKVALETNSLSKGLEKNGASLQYIDLRFGNKVFYKFD